MQLRKTYLGEAITADDFAASNAFLQWAAERFPDSAVFEFWQMELHVIRTEIHEASRPLLHLARLTVFGSWRAAVLRTCRRC